MAPCSLSGAASRLLLVPPHSEASDRVPHGSWAWWLVAEARSQREASSSVPPRCLPLSPEPLPSWPPSPSAGPQVPQEGLPGAAFRSSLLCAQAQTLGPSLLSPEVDWDLHSSLQVCERLAGPCPGAGARLVPWGGDIPAPGLAEHRLTALSVSVPCSPCSSPWTPAAVARSGTAPSPPAACWTRPSVRRPGRARAWRRSRTCRSSRPAARAGGTRWPRSPPASPRAPPHVSVPVGQERGPVVGLWSRCDGQPLLMTVLWHWHL